MAGCKTFRRNGPAEASQTSYSVQLQAAIRFSTIRQPLIDFGRFLPNLSGLRWRQAERQARHTSTKRIFLWYGAFPISRMAPRILKESRVGVRTPATLLLPTQSPSFQVHSFRRLPRK